MTEFDLVDKGLAARTGYDCRAISVVRGPGSACRPKSRILRQDCRTYVRPRRRRRRRSPGFARQSGCGGCGYGPLASATSRVWVSALPLSSTVPPTNAATKATFLSSWATMVRPSVPTPARFRTVSACRNPETSSDGKPSFPATPMTSSVKKGALALPKSSVEFDVELHLQFAIAGRDRPADPSVGIAPVVVVKPRRTLRLRPGPECSVNAAPTPPG